MDAERCRFLFGTDESPVDPHDEDEFFGWFADRLPEVDSIGGMFRGIVARQILLDTPPEMWATARRLTALGLDRDEALEELTRPIMIAFGRALGPDDEPGRPDGERLRRMLDLLPSPSDDEVDTVLIEAAAAEPGIDRDELLAAALAALGRAGDDELVLPMVDALLDDLVEDGQMVELAGDRVAHLPSLLRGRAFTHRLGETSANRVVLFSLAGDLAPLLSIRGVRTPEGDDLETVELGGHPLLWKGPDGWLDSFADDGIVAVRVDAAGVVTLEAIGEAEPSDELVSLVGRVAAEELADRDTPMSFGSVVAALILADPSVFTVPTAPLSELFRRSGLDPRGAWVARDDDAWLADELADRHDRLHEASDNEDAVHTAMDVLDTFDEEYPTPEDLRAALHDLDDPEVFALVLEEVLGDIGTEDEDAMDGLAASLVAAARRPRDVAIAHLIAAHIAQAIEDGASADEHARAAVRADRTLGPAIDLAAYYASVRGDAATAARLWRTLEDPDEDDLKGVVPFLAESSPKLGRNDPCWCGSGRKFKACHQGKVEEAALPDRVGWMCNKAAGFLRRSGREAGADVVAMLLERAVDTDDRASLAEASADPVVFDAVLTEGGWFERFLDTMNEVLPADEALLLESWVLVDRTVYEFENVHPGKSIEVRDIATGERFSVRERTLSGSAQEGSFWCGRAVPDGQTTQFIGAIFPVAPGRETAALEMCERKSGYDLCSWVRALYAPPTLTTREGEPLVTCTMRLRVPDASAATTVLDALYECDDDSWTDMFDIGGGERIVRGHITMADDLIEVSTSSEPRMDRILATLLDRLPGATVESDEREPFRPEQLSAGRREGASALPSIQLSAEDREEILQMLEHRWMTEPVPALGGVTPQEAAADPTRRESLRRLLATFPTNDDPDVLLFRPDRLRAELGL